MVNTLFLRFYTYLRTYRITNYNHSSLDGVDHLIRFFCLNHLPSFRILHSTFACWFFIFYLACPIAAPAFSRSTFVSRINLSCFWSIVETKRKIRRRAENRSLDPWSDKLLCWPLDHATPPSLSQVTTYMNTHEETSEHQNKTLTLLSTVDFSMGMEVVRKSPAFGTGS